MIAFAQANPGVTVILIIMALFVAATALGKGKQFLSVLDAATNILNRIERDINFMSDKNGSITWDQKAALINDGLSALTDKTPLTYTQAAAVCKRDPETKKLTVNKFALGVTLLKSSAGKEAQREFRDGFDWLTRKAKNIVN